MFTKQQVESIRNLAQQKKLWAKDDIVSACAMLERAANLIEKIYQDGLTSDNAYQVDEFLADYEQGE